MTEQWLKEALAEYKQVWVPGLGVFKVAFAGAEIREGGSQIAPPDNRVSFEEGAILDDPSEGISITDFMIAGGVGAEDSRAYTEDFTQRVYAELLLNERASVDELGFFEKNPFGELEFTQYEGVRLRPDSFGLTELEVQPLVAPPDEELKNGFKVPLPFLLAAIPVVLIAAAGIYFWLNPQVYEQLWSVNPDKEAPAIVNPVAEPSTEIASAEDTSAEFNPAENTEPVTEQPPVATTPTRQPDPIPAATVQSSTPTRTTPAPVSTSSADLGEVVSSKTGRFFIVIGSYSDMEKARVGLAEAKKKGYPNARVVTAEQKFRVSVEDHPTRNEALQAAENVKQNYQSAWVLAF